jgi:hypothetical protein
MDMELTAAIKQAKTRRVNFVMIGKGMDAPTLLLARGSRISPERIKELREETGGKIVNRGQCWFEEDTIVFHCEKKPSWNLVDHLRKMILRETSMLVRVELRTGSAKPKAKPQEGEEETEVQEPMKDLEDEGEMES